MTDTIQHSQTDEQQDATRCPHCKNAPKYGQYGKSTYAYCDIHNVAWWVSYGFGEPVFEGHPDYEESIKILQQCEILQPEINETAEADTRRRVSFTGGPLHGDAMLLHIDGCGIDPDGIFTVEDERYVLSSYRLVSRDPARAEFIEGSIVPPKHRLKGPCQIVRNVSLRNGPFDGQSYVVGNCNAKEMPQSLHLDDDGDTVQARYVFRNGDYSQAFFEEDREHPAALSAGQIPSNHPF